MEEIRKALELKKILDKLRPIDMEQENRIMQKFRLDWNYHSNHLEGNSLTYGETKALILFGVTAQGKPLKDTLEITGHNEAINWVLDIVKENRSLTENFIRELHKLLLKESYEVDAITSEGKPTKKKIAIGTYKTTPNHVKTKTGEIFYFATPEETPSKMYDLLHWFATKSIEKEVNPILLSAEFHYKFIRIHPFDDGNGRTARILMNFILMQFGFPPTIIKSDKESKDAYFAALQLADAGNIEAFINYIAENLNHSLEIMIAGANGEEIEEPEDLDKEIALLEQRLSGFGDKIDKVKSKENIGNIYVNTILITAKEIKQKLSKFEKYYLKFGYFIIVEGKKPIELSQVDLNFIEIDLPNNIRLYITLNSIKIKGLEDYSFKQTITFDFRELNYFIFEEEFEHKCFYTKNYIDLTEVERHSIVKHVVNNHNLMLDKALKK
jgi:Fic family protein